MIGFGNIANCIKGASLQIKERKMTNKLPEIGKNYKRKKPVKGSFMNEFKVIELIECGDMGLCAKVENERSSGMVAVKTFFDDYEEQI